MLVMPVALTLSMLAVFKGLVGWLGFPLGYLAAFLIYWIGWCLLLPMLVLNGPRGVLDLFREAGPRFGKPAWKALVLLWWPVVLAILFRFIPEFSQANTLIILVSIALGIVIGITEEILWRGVYIKLFPDNVWLGYIYPAAGFAAWHIAPQSVSQNPSPGGALSFVLAALLLGLSWGYYAWKTKSIRWCTIAHAVNDSFGLGALVYAVWLM